ncbi:MAG TPA: DUF1653 domain-containing protein, partial [bacterium]|nr:DUF1653 domain-containing protein [bacterium]
TETLEKLVLYKHKTPEKPGGYWVRPYDNFHGEKELPDGTKVKRFVYVGDKK